MAMHKILAIGLLSLSGFRLSAQEINLQAVSDSIMKTAGEMYALESAGWTAVEAVKTKFSIEHIEDYLAYRDGDTVKVAFITDRNKIKYTFRFTDTLNPSDFLIDGKERRPNKVERRLFRILKNTNRHAVHDGLVDFIDNTRFNTVILPTSGIYHAYLLTGMENDSILPLGNDYLFAFSKSGRLKSFNKLHNNLITIAMRPESDPKTESVASIHTHSVHSFPFITVTDVCTLMLYRQSFNWHIHIVFSNAYVSYLDLSHGSLKIMTREAYEALGH